MRPALDGKPIRILVMMKKRRKFKLLLACDNYKPTQKINKHNTLGKLQYNLYCKITLLK